MTQKKQSKVVKAWAVIWSYQHTDKYITSAHHYTDAAAIFSDKKRANRFAGSYTNNNCMKVVPVTITYQLPAKTK